MRIASRCFNLWTTPKSIRFVEQIGDRRLPLISTVQYNNVIRRSWRIADSDCGNAKIFARRFNKVRTTSARTTQWERYFARTTFFAPTSSHENHGESMWMLFVTNCHEIWDTNSSALPNRQEKTPQGSRFRPRTSFSNVITTPACSQTFSSPRAQTPCQKWHFLDMM